MPLASLSLGTVRLCVLSFHSPNMIFLSKEQDEIYRREPAGPTACFGEPKEPRSRSLCKGFMKFEEYINPQQPQALIHLPPLRRVLPSS